MHRSSATKPAACAPFFVWFDRLGYNFQIPQSAVRAAPAGWRDYKQPQINKKENDWGTLRKEGASIWLLYLNFIVFLKRCNLCGFAVFSLLRSLRCCRKASSIFSGVSSRRMPRHLTAALFCSLPSGRSWQSHIPFGRSFNCQVDSLFSY